MIKVVCAYCGEQYGTKDDGRDDGEISHGSCQRCGAIELAKLDAMTDEEIERITRAA